MLVVLLFFYWDRNDNATVGMHRARTRITHTMTMPAFLSLSARCFLRMSSACLACAAACFSSAFWEVVLFFLEAMNSDLSFQLCACIISHKFDSIKKAAPRRNEVLLWRGIRGILVISTMLGNSMPVQHRPLQPIRISTASELL